MNKPHVCLTCGFSVSFTEEMRSFTSVDVFVRRNPDRSMPHFVPVEHQFNKFFKAKYDLHYLPVLLVYIEEMMK